MYLHWLSDCKMTWKSLIVSGKGRKGFSCTFILLISIDLVLCSEQTSALSSISSCDNSSSSEEPPVIHFVPPSSPTSSSSSPTSILESDESPSEIIDNAESQGNALLPDLVFKGCKVRAEFLCSANYPIEWIESYDKDVDELTDTNDQIYKNMWTDRIINESVVSNSSTYLSSLNGSYTSYNAFLGLTYPSLINTTFCFAANYSCRSVANPCLQSSVISVVDRENETISYEYSNNSMSAIHIRNDTDGGEGSKSKCDAVITVTVKHGHPGWRCTGQNGNPRDLTPYTKKCDAAMHCNSYFLHDKNRSCVRRLLPTEDCLGCRYKNATTNRFHPGYIWCEGDDEKVLTALLYFYSVPQTLNNSAIPELYLDWKEADPQKMLYLKPLPNEVVYVGEHLTLICQISRFYFSFGHRFGLEFENASIWYTSSIDGDSDHWFNVNKMTITFPVEPGLKRVYCLAPVWNSPEWVNQSLEITVKDGIAPTVMITDGIETSRNSVHSVTFPLHGANASLSCLAEGTPVPNITWSKDGLPINPAQGSIIDVGSGRKDLIFPFVTYPVKGVYKCEGSSHLGVISKIVKVSVRDEFALWVQLASVGLLFLVTGFLVVLILCWKKIQRQRRALRLLTDSEVNEFRDGNLEILEASEYLDTDELIHALPYNDEFEIPCDRLYIDMTNVLGTGNFGQVVKGTISDRSNKRRVDTEVAVKTVKPNHDVTYFKTLLSEVKIMAYIGHHPNVVSLVGACTGNIRKREIFIAVEYCAKGSLEKVLKNCRSSFINLICNDTLYVTTSFSSDKEGSQSASKLIQVEPDIPNLASDSLTTAHLLKWCREIANGMEFLGSKKVIHGDLATRNVLLMEGLVAKIGDFGLSRQLMEYKNYVRSTDTDIQLPWKWMSVETLEDRTFSVQSDVWSYGVTLWEIFTLGSLPYPGITWNFRFLDEIKNGMRLHKPTYAHSQIYNVMLECWSLEACQRPSFTELKDFFEGLLLQTCDDEYIETKYIGNSKNYVNGSHNFRVNNPGYSNLGSADEVVHIILPNSETSNGTEDEVSEHKLTMLSNGKRTRTATSPEDKQGYLRPLMFESEEQS